MFSKTLLAATTAVLMITGLTACVEANKAKDPQTIVKEFNEKWANSAEFKGEVKIKNIKNTDAKGFYLVEMEKGGSGYITADGKYLIGGPILQLEGNKVVELGEKLKSSEAKELLKTVDTATQAITYKPAGGIKHTLYVFTDPSCSACQFFHKETDALIKNGVQIHYLPWARGAESLKGINDVWCAKDKKVAYESATKSEPFVSEKCENTVEKSIEIGKKLEVRATPTIYTEDGRVITGAIPAQNLLEFLNPEAKEKPASEPATSEVAASEVTASAPQTK